MQNKIVDVLISRSAYVKRCGVVVRIPASYSGITGLETSAQVLLSPFTQMLRYYFKTGHDASV